MITVLNSQEGVVSKADETRRDGQKTRGNKGFKQVYVEQTDENEFALRVRDFGNFGKCRWYIDVDGLNMDDLEDMRQCLDDVIQGRAVSSAVPVEEVTPEEEATESEQETEVEAEAADDTQEDVEAHVVADTEAADMDELTA